MAAASIRAEADGVAIMFSIADGGVAVEHTEMTSSLAPHPGRMVRYRTSPEPTEQHRRSGPRAPDRCCWSGWPFCARPDPDPTTALPSNADRTQSRSSSLAGAGNRRALRL